MQSKTGHPALLCKLATIAKHIGNKKAYCRQIKVICTFFIMNVIKMEVNTEKVFFYLRNKIKRFIS